MQFSREENQILEAVAISEIIADLDFEEKIIFWRLYGCTMSLRQVAKSLNVSHVWLVKKRRIIQKKIGYHFL